MAIISSGHRLYTFIMRSNDLYGFGRIAVAWGESLPYAINVKENPREYLASFVSFLPYVDEIEIFIKRFLCCISDKEVNMCGQEFHDYSTIMQVKHALFWPQVSFFFTVIMLEFCLS